MIKAKELRIGNKIYPLKDCDEVVDVTDLDGDSGRIGTTAFFYNNKGTCDTSSDAACGIPLTSEWLERCGLKEEANYLFGKHLKLGIHTDYTYIGTITSTSAAFVAPTQYVHQLQNLYFALTGDELEIKLP